MVRTIELIVSGVDIDDDATDELLSVHLSDFGWFVRDGITTATVYLEQGTDAVSAACDAANRIENLTGGKAVRVHEDPVGVSDIALRTGLHRETVRLLTRGQRGPGGFPAHRGTVGSGANSARIWHWADVLPWLHEHYKLCLDEQSLTARETTRINAHLEQVTHDFDSAWRQSTRQSLPLHADIVWAGKPATVVAIEDLNRNATMPREKARSVPVAAGTPPDGEGPVETVDARLEPAKMRIAPGELSLRFQHRVECTNAVGEAVATIETGVMIDFDVEGDDEPELALVDCFADTNGAFMAWPYIREAVQSMSVRLGLAPITLGVLRRDEDAYGTDDPQEDLGQVQLATLPQT